MKRWYQRVVMLFSIAAAPLALSAQKVARSPETVLFVCEHGTVKSLLAKVLFEEYAAEVGLPVRALSRGTQADSIVPSWMQQRLADDHFALAGWRPQALRPEDLTNASYVISFDVPTSATAAARAPRTQWDGLPSVSKDYSSARDAIKARVHQLVDSLNTARARAQRAPARTDSLDGIWRGTSLCTDAGKPACHDETVVYHFRLLLPASPNARAARRYEWQMNKVVNGQEEEMATLMCDVETANQRVTCPMRDWAWTFYAQGDSLRGTLANAAGVTWRNIRVGRSK